MIEAKVVFDGSNIIVNGHSVLEIYTGDSSYIFMIDDIEKEDIKTLEQAIKYCMEN